MLFVGRVSNLQPCKIVQGRIFVLAPMIWKKVGDMTLKLAGPFHFHFEFVTTNRREREMTIAFLMVWKDEVNNYF